MTGAKTISALPNSLQMELWTLAFQKRLSKVWKLLGFMKIEFGKIGEVLEKTLKELQEASDTIKRVPTKIYMIEQKLINMEGFKYPRNMSYLKN